MARTGLIPGENFLLIESLQRYHFFFGDDFKVEFPGESGSTRMNLWQVASRRPQRLVRIFTPGEDGVASLRGSTFRDGLRRDLLLFHEYFHGETGAGVGANHQTGMGPHGDRQADPAEWK
ncbi:MAG: hypothetical protein U0842_12540 [Candidatus Binatia bacterium]